LRRSWLLGALAPYIEKVATKTGSTRSPELLALADEDLARLMAPNDHERILERVARVSEGQMAEAIGRVGCWAVCHHDTDRFPPGLGVARDAPRALIGRGEQSILGDLEPEASVTIVGARRCSSYAREVAVGLGRDLARAGLIVVSGMAQGIDGAAHRGALESGRTVAVLGCGADRAYPAVNRGVYRQICESGLVLSELPPGEGPWRWTFPARNRMMAAMSRLTVVVEAAFGSGSLITADLASEGAGSVGAVPGQVTSQVAAGSNELLHAGAVFIRDAQDVLDAMLGVGVVSVERSGPQLDSLLFSALEVCEREGAEAGLIAEATGIGIPEAAAALSRLELLGYLEGSALGSFTRTPLAAAPAP